MSTDLNKREFLAEALHINAKLSAVIEGEQSLPALHALLALAVHCTHESNMRSDEALSLFRKMLDMPRQGAS